MKMNFPFVESLLIEIGPRRIFGLRRALAAAAESKELPRTYQGQQESFSLVIPGARRNLMGPRK